MDQIRARRREYALLSAPASVRRRAERRLSSIFRRAKREVPSDKRALALAVALSEVSDEVFLEEMLAVEQAGWQIGLPHPSTVYLRLAWDASMDGDYGVREVRGWDFERIGIADAIVRERGRTPLSDAVSKVWDFDRSRSFAESSTSPVCEFVPRLSFGPAPTVRISSIRDGEPYFVTSDGTAVGAYCAWYGLDPSTVLQYELGLHSWMKAEWPEALDVFDDEPCLEGHPFSAWVMKRSAEALIRRLSFEEATVMMMDDQVAEDRSWL